MERKSRRGLKNATIIRNPNRERRLQSVTMEHLEKAFGTVRSLPITGGRLEDPESIVYCPTSQCLYAIDSCRICKIIRTGVMFVVAGSAGTCGYVDAKSGRDARFNYPQGIDVDGEGNIYVADTFNHRIRKITSPGKNGEVSTVAGNGSHGFRNGPALDASFSSPRGIAVSRDSGHIHVVDMWNHSVRTISNGIVTTLAGRKHSEGGGDNNDEDDDDEGQSTAQFDLPFDIAMKHDGSGDVYVSDTGSGNICKINSLNGETRNIATLPRGGSSSSSSSCSQDDDDIVRFQFPNGICAGSDGTVYAAYYRKNIIRMVEPCGKERDLGEKNDGDKRTEVTTIFNNPRRLTISNDGYLYVLEGETNSIRIVDIRAKELGPKYKRMSDDLELQIKNQLAEKTNLSVELDKEGQRKLDSQTELRNWIESLLAEKKNLSVELDKERLRTLDSQTELRNWTREIDSHLDKIKNLSAELDEEREKRLDAQIETDNFVNHLLSEKRISSEEWDGERQRNLERQTNAWNIIKAKDEKIDSLVEVIKEEYEYKMNSITELKEARLHSVGPCVICFDRRRELIFHPCNHVVCCRQCWEVETAHRRGCPCCRAAVEQVRQVLYS